MGLSVLALALATPTAAAAASFARGPYLQDLGSRQVAVLLELDAPHAVTLEIARGVAGDAQPGAGASKTVTGSTDRVHELVAGGLEPATSYRYTVRVDDGTTATGSFTTAPEDDRPFRFLLYGDNRSDGTAHAAVVHQMLQTPGDFLVQTGDMVADGSDPADWLRFFAIEHDLLRDRCTFAAIGNHEIALPTSDGALRFARLFRNAGPAGSRERYSTFRWGDARFFMLDAQDDFASEERAWLEGALVAADAEPGLTWRFAVLHHGPYSSGLHGPNVALQLAHVPELLRTHHVDAVFSGHDHVYERGEVPVRAADGAVGPLRYVISGGGGAPLYPEHRDEPTVQRFEAVHHFLSVEVTRTQATLTAIRKDGSVLERCTIAPGGVGGWTGCPSAHEAAAATNGASSPSPANGAPAPGRRACDCSFALHDAEWVGGCLATALLLVAGVRRKTRPDDPA